MSSPSTGDGQLAPNWCSEFGNWSRRYPISVGLSSVLVLGLNHSIYSMGKAIFISGYYCWKQYLRDLYLESKNIVYQQLWLLNKNVEKGLWRSRSVGDYMMTLGIGNAAQQLTLQKYPAKILMLHHPEKSGRWYWYFCSYYHWICKRMLCQLDYLCSCE